MRDESDKLLKMLELELERSVLENSMTLKDMTPEQLVPIITKLRELLYQLTIKQLCMNAEEFLIARRKSNWAPRDGLNVSLQITKEPDPSLH